MKRLMFVVIPVLAALLIATWSRAAVFTQNRGTWPQSWPEELEGLRETSRTLGVGTAIQENIYEIPIRDRETFERVWPAILKLRSPNGTLTLDRIGEAQHPEWGDMLSNQQPAVRIFAPSGGYSSKEAVDPAAKIDMEQLVREGKALRGDAPWPKEIVGPNGELPEFVVAEKGDDGTMKWVPASPWEDQKTGKLRGFYNRARIDLELVVDGTVIDLNRTEFPDGVPVLDRRFEKPE